ncbi:sugar transporter SWEET1-like [Lineus longissimus]|uniref:sugar transporter SWEET1-like n=1 Tax=Lineus longissimus TaxID=88925 RepID=UPI002B4E7F4E
MALSTLELVEWATFLSTLVVTVAAVPASLHMLKTKNTVGYPFIFFMIACVNSLCLVGYGHLIENPEFVKMNLMGVAFNAVYFFCYVYVTNKKMNAMKYLFGGLFYVASVYAYCSRLEDKAKMTDSLGFINTVATMILFLSPLLEVPDFVHAKSCEGMPLMMLVSGTICSLSWTVYGKMLDDPYIYAPNFPSFFTNGVYFLLLIIYGRGDKSKTD